MPPDTSGEGEEGSAAPGPRSLRWEEWVRAPRFVGGASLVVLGVLVVGLVALGRGATPSGTTGDQVIFVGVVAVMLGAALALSGYRLGARQQQYLDQAERIDREIRDYLELLEDVALEEPESTWEIRSRLERARTNLERARRAARRREYANFLSLYYEASRQEILLYGLLDYRADGWTFGLDIHPRPEGDRGSASARLLNLGRRIRSYAAEALPEQRRELVETYLGESDDPPTPLGLFYAVRVLHEWNVSRYERATQVRQFLRGGILVLVAVLVGLAAVLGVGFVDVAGENGSGIDGNGSDVSGNESDVDGSSNGVNGRGSGGFLAAVNATSDPPVAVPADSVLLNDAFLGLVVLTGALGALFSMVYRSFGEFYSLTTDPSVPEPVFMTEALLARTLFGGVSALFLFLVARTEFAGVVFAADLLKNPLALLVLSFVAGFSERLVDETVDKLTEELDDSEEREGTSDGGERVPGDSRADGSDGPDGASETGETDTADGTDETGGAVDTDGPDETDDGDEADETSGREERDG